MERLSPPSSPSHHPSSPTLENEPFLVSRPLPPSSAKPHSRLITTLTFMLLHFLLAFSEIILVSPLLSLYQKSACLRYYGFPEGGVEESDCKALEIFSLVIRVRGWKNSFDVLPVLLVAIPIGKLGDRYGRRKIMALALLGVAVSMTEIFIVCAFPKVFPLQMIWLSSVILLCGGGLNSASAFMWAMAAECIPEENRSHSFYYIFSAFYIAEFAASATAAATTDISPWIPCGLAMGSVILGLLLLAVMPDAPQSPKPIPRVSEGNDDESIHSTSPLKYPSVNGLMSALSNRNIRLTLPVFLVGIFRYATLGFLLQYAYFRFDVWFSTGAMFFTETAVVNMFLFLFLIPNVTVYIRKKYNVRPEIIDLFLVRMSVTLMCVGCLAIALAQSKAWLPVGVFIFAAGFGSRVSALSLVSYWISDDSKATLYAAIVVLESLGHAVGDPAMAQIFSASLMLPTFWTAMPFFFAAVIYFIAIVSTSFIKIEKKSEDGEEEPLIAMRADELG